MADLTLPDEIQLSLDSVDSAMAAFEALAGQLGELPNALKDTDVQPLERGRINLKVAQAINSVVLAYIGSLGISSDDHPIQKEQERVHLYGAKLEKVSKDYQGRARPVVALDVAAAGRFIEHSIPHLTHEQKRGVRDASRRSKEEVLRPLTQGPSRPLPSPKSAMTDAVFKSVNEEILIRKRRLEQQG